ncbi:MAG TPA: hypothetical protein ENI65_07070 [Gammaproteobacteria bacterium]|nr:hypothetical protein [Gammaproteobacteria bacterium]
MKAAALSLAQTPPLSVPYRFFLTAPLFAVACGVTLFWAGPDVLSSRWHPALLAATHLLTLGFLTMVMAGALQQLTPVLMGVQISYPLSFSTVIHLLLVAGTLALTAGWLWQKTALFTLAGVLLGLALTGFILVLLVTLRKARSGHTTVRSTTVALLAFAVTVVLGVYLALGYSWNGLERLPGMTDQHMTWGLVGWVSLLIMGVAYQVIPMFQITPDYPGPMMRWLAILMFLLLSCWSLVQIFFPQTIWLSHLAGGLLASGLVFFLLVSMNLLSRRRRYIPDVTLNFWRVSLSSLLLVVIAWGLSLTGTHDQLEIFFGVLMITGFSMSAISGMLYKIAPFLIWLHLNNYIQGRGHTRGNIPNMKQVIPERHARLHFRAHCLMLLLFILAVFWPDYFLRPAALLLIITAGILWNNLYSGFRLYKHIIRNQEA